MPDPTPHVLPSSDLLTDFSAFFTTARFNKDGTATITLTLPAEMKPNLIELSNNDGMLLNFRVWETKLPDGMEKLAEVIGLTE